MVISELLWLWRMAFININFASNPKARLLNRINVWMSLTPPYATDVDEENNGVVRLKDGKRIINHLRLAARGHAVA